MYIKVSEEGFNDEVWYQEDLSKSKLNEKSGNCDVSSNNDSNIIRNANRNSESISIEFEGEYGKENLSNMDASEAKFSEEDIPIADYEYIFRPKEDLGDLEEYYKGDKDYNWEWDDNWFNKDHNEELFEGKVDWSEEIGGLSHKLGEQCIELSGTEGDHGQSTFWPDAPPRKVKQNALGFTNK